MNYSVFIKLSSLKINTYHALVTNGVNNIELFQFRIIITMLQKLYRKFKMDVYAILTMFLYK